MPPLHQCPEFLHDVQASLEAQKAAIDKRRSGAEYEKAPEHVQLADQEKHSKAEAELHAVQLALKNLTTSP